MLPHLKNIHQLYMKNSKEKRFTICSWQKTSFIFLWLCQLALLSRRHWLEQKGTNKQELIAFEQKWKITEAFLVGVARFKNVAPPCHHTMWQISSKHSLTHIHKSTSQRTNAFKHLLRFPFVICPLSLLRYCSCLLTSIVTSSY